MVKIRKPGAKDAITINAMIDSGATEEFIDEEVCNKHGIKMIKAKNPSEIYLANGKPSAMGPVTHMTKVPMHISSHWELATFPVANLQNHEAILGMPWSREHNSTIDWNDKRITFNSERCTTWCLNSLPILYVRPEEEPWEENLMTRLSRSRQKKAPRPMTRVSELRSHRSRLRCQRRDQPRRQDTTCAQLKELTFLPGGKRLLGRG